MKANHEAHEFEKYYFDLYFLCKYFYFLLFGKIFEGYDRIEEIESLLIKCENLIVIFSLTAIFSSFTKRPDCLNFIHLITYLMSLSVVDYVTVLANT